ncbi:MAG TPA: TM2 domain-containing protein [Patescibacteria group bacterium]|nr:TM2 domain-containing protein [Patescibacteria group bacterium]
MSNITSYLPNVEGRELFMLEHTTATMTESQRRYFAAIYGEQRKEPMMVLGLGLLGFMGFGGINRFYVKKIGSGILYFLTGGLFFIGTILDIFKYRDLAYQYNEEKALDIAMAVKKADNF